jgi:hypothetical protein
MTRLTVIGGAGFAAVALFGLAAACSPQGVAEAAGSPAETSGIDMASKAQSPAADDDLADERALADRLMAAMGYDVMAESMPDVFADASARSLLACTPATPEQDVRRLSSLMREELVAAMPRYYERIRDSYARRLSLEQLEALAEFYETPAGREVAEAAAELIYDQFIAQVEIDRAALRAYERMGWCDNAL